MAITTDERLQKVHARAMRNNEDVQTALRAERLQCLQDRRFYSIAGAQWEGALYDMFANRPMFEVNKIHLAIIRIINEYRNNRITVDFVAKDGTQNDKLADTCDDLYRADEQDSVADEAYDNAFEEGVGGGIGAWRLRADYEDELDPESEYQKVCIDPIFDADSSVFFDLNAKRYDKSDAKWAEIITGMPRQTFIEEYGQNPNTWPKQIEQARFDWATPDIVFVSEYYEVELKKEVVHVYKTVDGKEERYTDREFEADEELEEYLKAIGSKKVREKKIKRKRVHKYLISGGGVLEDCGYIAGENIPIVPFYGKRWFIDGVERCMGHVRLAKDSQRISNMLRSKLGELTAQGFNEKPIFIAQQILNHQQQWSDDYIQNYPYLMIDALKDKEGNPVYTGPVGYTKPPAIPPALAALLQISDQDMKEILGNQEGGEEIAANISGKAVELIQTRLDMQSYIYQSNMAKSMKRSGEIWLSMKREITVEKGRKMRGIDQNGTVRQIELLRPYANKETGEVEYENDLSKASFGVAVEVGPSSSSKRDATVRKLTAMMGFTQDPETMNVLSALAMMNMEGEGLTETREYYRKKLISMGVVKPNEQEAQEMAKAQANQPPDPNAVYLEAAAQEAAAKANKAQAETLLTMEKTANTRANTAKIISDIDVSEQQQALEVIDRLMPQAPEAQDVSVVAVKPTP